MTVFLWLSVMLPILGIALGLYLISCRLNTKTTRFYRSSFSYGNNRIDLSNPMHRLGISAIVLVVALGVAGGLHSGSFYTATWDTEYWTSFVSSSEYWEEWTERCTRTVTDDKGNSHTETYYVYHGPEYYVKTTSHESVSVDYDTFKRLASKYGNKTKKSVWHPGQSSWGDGNMFYTVWNGPDVNQEVCNTTHRYTNKIHANPGVFNFVKYTKEEAASLGLHQYPGLYNYYACSSLIGMKNPQADWMLQLLNAKYGPTHQVRVWVVVFDASKQSVSTGIAQENFWEGGNKNELCICIGLKAGVPDWCHTFSWTDNQYVKINIRNFVQNMKSMDWAELTKFVSKEIETDWQRKNFKDFDYISVQVGVGWVIAAWIIQLLIAVGCVVYSIFGEI